MATELENKAVDSGPNPMQLYVFRYDFAYPLGSLLTERCISVSARSIEWTVCSRHSP